MTHYLSRKREEDEYRLISFQQAEYPRRAQTRGISGFAVIEFTISNKGNVKDIILIEEMPEGWLFGKTALEAATKLKYKPRMINGVPQEVEGVTIKFPFIMQK